MIDGNDMIVNLYRLPTLEDRKDTIQIKRAFVGDKEAILTFIKENFSNSWVYEAEHALLQEVPKCFIAVENKKVIGFACFDSSAKGFFGPIGVLSEYRGKRVGQSLLLKTLEDLCGIMETFVSTNEIDMDSDEILNQILTIQLPDACLYYVDEPGEEQKRELGFWKELKDIEYKLRYGYSFWKKQESRKSKIKEDPVEYTDEYLRVELELERLIRSEIGEEKYLGFCHKYWSTKKNILKNKFEIAWKSPAELNPTIRFD